MTRQASDTRMALSRCALFKHAAPAVLASVEHHAKSVHARRGERILNAGERCPGVYIVASGRVALSVVSRPDASKVFDLVSSGNHFGLAATILDSAQNVTAHALADSVLVMIPRATLLEAAGEHAQFGLQLVTALSRGVAALTDDIESHALHSGRQRVANYLLRVAAANAARGRP